MSLKVRINGNIGDLYRRIVEYHSKFEVRDFSALSLNEREEVFSETFERRFMAFWNSSQRSTVFKKGIDDEDSKEQNTDIGKSLAKLQKRVISPQKKEIDFVAILDFNFDTYNNFFEIGISSATAETPEIKQEYTKFLNEELDKIKFSMENGYTQRMFLKDFFATLHVRRLSFVTGTEATLMYDVYRRAIDAYPAFKRICYEHQMDVMHKAYMRGRARTHAAHDVYGFAKATLQQFDAEGLIGELADGSKKVYERRITRRNPEIRSEIWELNYPVYITYERKVTTGDRIRTSYHPSDLWLKLAQL